MIELAPVFIILALFLLTYGIIILCHPVKPWRCSFFCFFLLVMAFACIIASGMMHLAEVKLLPVFFRSFEPFARIAFVFFFMLFAASFRFTQQIKTLQAKVEWYEQKYSETRVSQKRQAIEIKEEPSASRIEPPVMNASSASPDAEKPVPILPTQGSLPLGCFDLREAIDEALEGARLSFHRKVQITRDLPAEPLYFKGDMGQIELIVANLCVNGGEAMPEGGKLALKLEKVRNTGETSNDFEGLSAGLYGILTVSDTGKGIPHEMHARIFEPFFTTKAEGSGAGMGLATVMQVVKKYRGSASFKSKPDTGTTFKVILPVVDAG